MRKTFNYYGDMVIAFLAISLMLTYIFTNMTDTNGNRGLYNIIASYNNVKIYDFTQFQDSRATKDFAVIEKPILELNTASQIVQGHDYSYNELFTLKQAEKTIKSIYVASVKKNDGTDCSNFIHKDTKTLNFADAGDYTVEVKVSDNEDVTADSNINIAVNR